MKYVIYFCNTQLDESTNEQAIVGVAYGNTIESAELEIGDIIREDISARDEYKHCDIGVCDIDSLPLETNEESKYDFCIDVIVYPPNAPLNIILVYGIIEKNENE